MYSWISNMDLFWQGKHDQRLHVYVVERLANLPNDETDICVIL